MIAEPVTPSIVEVWLESLEQDARICFSDQRWKSLLNHFDHWPQRGQIAFFGPSFIRSGVVISQMLNDCRLVLCQPCKQRLIKFSRRVAKGSAAQFTRPMTDILDSVPVKVVSR